MEIPGSLERINLHTGYILPDAKLEIVEHFPEGEWSHWGNEYPVTTIYFKTENANDPFGQPTIRARIYEHPDIEERFYLRGSLYCVLELKYREETADGSLKEQKVRQTISGAGLRRIVAEPQRMKEILEDEYLAFMRDRVDHPPADFYPIRSMDAKRLDAFVQHIGPDTIIFPTLVTQRNKHHISYSGHGAVDDRDACRITVDLDYRFFGFEPVHRQGGLRRSGVYTGSENPLDSEAIPIGGHPFARYEIKGDPAYLAQMVAAQGILAAHEQPVQRQVAQYGHELYWRTMTGASAQYPLVFPCASSGRVPG